VAVRTPDLAFLDLNQNGSPAISFVYEAVNGLTFPLSIDVVEVEYDLVCLAAVNARLAGHVLPNLFLEDKRQCARALVITADVGESIGAVVLPPVSSNACLTRAMAPSSRLISKSKSFELFVLAANGAGGHERCLPSRKRWFACQTIYIL